MTTPYSEEPPEPEAAPEEPLQALPCDCCGGMGNHLGSCDTRYRAIMAALEGIKKGHLPDTLGDTAEDHANAFPYCARCGGSGVVPAEGDAGREVAL